MGWERRGNTEYFYKKERTGSTVKSVYVGRGEVANMISEIQASSPLLERLARSLKSKRALDQEKAETQLIELSDRVRVITQASLLAAGFHTHKRQWRKRRNGGADNSECDER